MADRIGVIRKGELILVEEKNVLMQKLGKKYLRLDLLTPLAEIPDTLAEHSLELVANGTQLIFSFDGRQDDTGIPSLLQQLTENGIEYRDLNTHTSSLEDIFVDLVKEHL